MKQVLQDLRTGATLVSEVPSPGSKPQHLLIATRVTLVSAGTERMLLAFGKANLIDKARQQPDKVRAALEKAKTDGILPTIDAVRRKLDEPLPMGYCNVGTVLDVGTGARSFMRGDRVVSNGKHAEVTCVPQNLCARIPSNVSDEAASFAVIGAIALQGLRLAAPTIGETFAVMGLGLVGLLAVQLLRANGCRVLAIDPDPARAELAATFGAQTLLLGEGRDPVEAALSFSRGYGVDGVIVAASTPSDEPIHQAASMCRQRGRIVLVGVTGLNLSRADFYEKELSFQVSCSYGPGRYDSRYEEGGADYPYGFVRWTAQRNFEAVLDLLASGAIDVSRLITHRFPLDDAQQAYAVLGGDQPSLGIVLNARSCVKATAPPSATRTIELDRGMTAHSKPASERIAFIGSGGYASGTLIPAFREAGAILRTIACSAGPSGASNGRKFGFSRATTETDSIFDDADVDAIVIATRHDLHARLACKALRAGKSVFVEKPLALTRQELRDVRAAYDDAAAAGAMLMVGFNRRFAPYVVEANRLLRSIDQPASFVMTVNAGAIPRNHWTQDDAIGGGRIVGEACHFIDLLRFLADAPIVSARALSLGSADPLDPTDKVSIDLRFANGSIGAIHYLSNGHRSFPKERLEIFCGGRILALANFRELRGYGWPRFRKLRSWRQDKGQRACARSFVDRLRSGDGSPIPPDQIFEVAEATLDVADAARNAL